MRNILALVTALALTAGTVQADTFFWINGSDSDGGDPGIGQLDASGGTGYIWARPDAEKTLANLSLNLVSDSAAVELTGVNVINPVMSQSGFPPKDVVRWEFDSPGNVAADAITGFGGFTVTSGDRIGAGIGPFTTSIDPQYDADSNAWLIASFDYNVAGDASNAGLWLQIGSNGANNAGERSADLNVVFGDPSDPALNGEADREVNSATVDATFGEGGGGGGGPQVPEPSTLILAGLAVLGMLGFRRNR